MTNCKKPILLDQSVPSCMYVCICIYVLNLFIHCCRYPLMDCLNSLFYFLLYNIFIRFGLYIKHLCRLSSLMRPMAIVLFDAVFTRAHTTLLYMKITERGIIPISSVPVIQHQIQLFFDSRGYQSYISSNRAVPVIEFR